MKSIQSNRDAVGRLSFHHGQNPNFGRNSGKSSNFGRGNCENFDIAAMHPETVEECLRNSGIYRRVPRKKPFL